MTKRTREEEVLRQFPTPGLYSSNTSPKVSRAKVKPAKYALPKHPDAALPACSATWKEAPDYVPQRVSPLRPGAEDFLQHPSRVNDERYYPLAKERK